MFYRNTLIGKKGQLKTYKFDLTTEAIRPYPYTRANELNEEEIDMGYNFIIDGKKLTSFEGFTDVAFPTSKTDLENESVLTLYGNEITALWSLGWYDSNSNENKYYMFYYDAEENKIRYDNLFSERVYPLVKNTTFTSTPIGIHYRLESNDVMIFSAVGGPLMYLSGSETAVSETAPALKSICTHDGKLFAITAEERGKLVYSQNPKVSEWTMASLSTLALGDQGGDMTKVISFNGKLYIFREFGITKVTSYGTKGEFDVIDVYTSDGIIYPNSIAIGGDCIYFYEKSGLKEFNGSSVKNIKTCVDSIINCEKSCFSGVCFEGRYFLACRIKYASPLIGCENHLDVELVNNCILVYDRIKELSYMYRGMDVRQFQVLDNPIKSKLVACFHGRYKNRIGMLSNDNFAKVFTEKLSCLWGCKWQYFGSEKIKKFKSLDVISNSPISFQIYIDEDQDINKFIVGNINSSDTYCSYPIEMKGRRIKFWFSSFGYNKIAELRLKYFEE